MNCINCGQELTTDMLSSGMCFACGYPTSESEKASEKTIEIEQSRIKAEKELAAQKRKEEAVRKSQEEQRLYDERLNNHMLTTGFSFEGYQITEYLGIVTGESIIGTGYLSEFDAALADTFGTEAIKYAQNWASQNRPS